MKHQLLLAAIIVGPVATGQSVRTEEKLSLRVTPSVSQAHCNLTVEATIARHRENRWLIVEADSGGF